MITVKDKQDCCGCGACAQRCPQSCIKMIEDEEGFLYPQIEISKCINCNLCINVCPVINKNNPQNPINSYAAINISDEIRSQSSSGGVFSAFSEAVLKKNGIVFGARFAKDWSVIHDYTETITDLYKFRSSKYVQSVIGNCFIQAEKFLKTGKIVLFSGTPCQISGLKHFLRKEYENLITVEIMCYGVPSPLIWRSYLHSISNKKSSITNINFRDKSTGWKKYNFSIEYSNKKCSQESHHNIFMYGFLEKLYIRPSCKLCPAKLGRSRSDLSIGDCWGIQNIMPELDDNKGINIVLVNTKKGKEFYESISVKSYNIDYNLIVKYNGGFNESIQFHPKRQQFFYKIRKGQDFTNVINDINKICVIQKLKNKIIMLLVNRIKLIKNTNKVKKLKL